MSEERNEIIAKLCAMESDEERQSFLREHYRREWEELREAQRGVKIMDAEGDLHDLPELPEYNATHFGVTAA